MNSLDPPPTSRVLSRLRKDDDSGFTMLAVIVSGILVLGLVLVAITFAIVAQRTSRGAADTKSALSAAQAGIQDFISRMNACEDYFNYPV